MKTVQQFLAAALSLLILTSCGAKSKNQTSDDGVVITAAGATFPLPYYNLAFKTYQQNAANDVTYGGVGSGGGIRSLKDKVVDFGGTDAYLSDKELANMPGAVLHIPTCMGAVVLAYNLAGVNQLNLNAVALEGIYQGTITSWDDPQIAALNPSVTLPKLAITPVYRSDGSGTTYVFSDYMSKASTAWAANKGTGKSLKWDFGVAAKGNPGVAGIIKQTPGAIGYIGSEYAFAVKIPSASLQNPKGEFVAATTATISAAANGAHAADSRQMITNSPAEGAYPISCFTWIILYKEQAYASREKNQAVQTLSLLKWMLSAEAQALTTKVHYAPLPTNVIEVATKNLDTVSFNGETL